MYEPSDFYNFCKANDVEVIAFSLPSEALTLKYGNAYAVGLDMGRIDTIRHFRTVTLHESGHLHTGALHKVDSPFQIVQQAEFRADADSIQRFLPPDEIGAAMRNGYVETWQLADYFDLDEEYIKKALHYWTECRGVDFNL